MESKESLRLRMKSMRMALEPDEVEQLGRRVAERLFSSSLIDGLSNLGLYASFRNEVPTEEIFHQLLQKKYRVFFPRVAQEGLVFARVESWAEMKPGAWGILEPSGDPLERIGELEAILVPGVAFDALGTRLGFGQGSYDRALQDYKGLKIGLAYNFQVLDTIPQVATDLRCDWIVTETSVIRGVGRKEQ